MNAVHSKQLTTDRASSTTKARSKGAAATDKDSENVTYDKQNIHEKKDCKMTYFEDMRVVETKQKVKV